MTHFRLLLSALTLCATVVLGGCNRDQARAGDSDAPRVIALDEPQVSSRAKGPAGGAGRAAREGAKERAATAKPEEASSAETTPTITVTGQVTFKDGGPAPDTLLTIVKFDFSGGERTFTDVASTTSSADGRYSLEVERSVSVSMKVNREGSVPAVTSIHLQSQQGAKRVTKNIALEPASFVRGRVVGPDDQPVSGARVKFVPRSSNVFGALTADSGVTTTTADGSFALEYLPDGEVDLAAVSDQYVATTQTATAPSENVVIRLASEGARVEGGVYDQRTGDAVGGATVTLVLRGADYRNTGIEPYKGVTDKLGSFTFDRLPAGTYTIAAAKDKMGLVPTADKRAYSLVLSEKQTTSELQLFLYPGHTVTGVVRDKAGKEPLAGVRVWTGYAKDAKEKGTDTDGQGRYRLTGVFSGGGTAAPLLAEKKGYVLEASNVYQRSVTVDLKADLAEAEKDLSMMRTVTISGIVKTEKDVPVSRAKATIFGSDDSPSRSAEGSVTDKDGFYELEADPYSKVRVTVEARDYPVTFSDMVDLDDRSTSVDIVLKQGGTVTGRVVDVQESSVAGATVNVTAIVQMGSSGHYVNLPDVDPETDGSFTINNLMTGQTVRLTADKTGFAKSRMEEITLSPGETKPEVKLVLREPHFISGLITDETSKPLEAVNVYAYNRGENTSSNFNARSDSKGRYRLENLPEGTYQVTASGQGWQEQQDGVKVDRDDVDFSVSKTKDEGVLIGRVVDAMSKAPLKDFSVEQRNGLEVEKDGAVAGRFKVTGLRPRLGYQLTIKAEEYRDLKSGIFSLPDGELTMERTFEMGAGGSITGRAVDKETKSPLAGVRVILRGNVNSWELNRTPPVATATTNAEGRFRFDEVSAGTNHLLLKPEQPLAEKAATAAVTHGEEKDLGDIELGGGATVRGRVVRMPGETPVPDVAIRLRDHMGGRTTEKSTQTDADGRFEFGNLPAGYFGLSVTAHKISRNVRVTDGATEEVTLQIGAGVLKGTVLRRKEPVPGASVNLSQAAASGSSLSAQTNPEGKFTLEGLTPGKWTVSVSSHLSGSSASGEDQIEIGEGETLERTFTINSGTLRGKVVDRDGKPVSGARLAIRVPESEGGAVRSMSNSQRDGTWKYEGMKPGVYTVTATMKGYSQSKPVRIEVPADGESEEGVSVLGGLEDTGTLVSITWQISDGKPLQKAWAKLKGEDGVIFEHDAQRDAEGVLTIEGVPPGTYDVEVSAWGFSVTNHPGTVIRTGETVRLEDVLHDCGSFDWKLTDKAGTPLPNVPVRFVPDDAASIEAVREGSTNAQGMYSTRGITPGQYTATATAPGKSPLILPVTIVAHEGVEKTGVVE